MKITNLDWLSSARHCPSPNYNARPDNANISLVVIHNISLPPNQFGYSCIDDFFTNQLNPQVHPYFEEIAELKVSSHFLIRRNGELVQYVACNKRAWHAGKSRFQGVENCNDFSLGIELEGADHIPYTEAQYQRLFALITELTTLFPTIVNITGHDFIAPERKTDPGKIFDWHYLCSYLNESIKFNITAAFNS